MSERGPVRRPIVWVIQNSKFMDKTYDPPRLMPKYDVSSAESYGDVTELLRPEAKPEDPSTITEMHAKLGGMQEEDYLLLIGNPVLIGLATAIAADYTGGVIQVLQWRRDGYHPIRHNVFPE